MQDAADDSEAPWTREAFVGRLRGRRERYHVEHPFQQRMIRGELNPDELRLWILNRFYYQRVLPRKDAAILANCEDREVRRRWRGRIIEQDGDPESGRPGGIEAWLDLAEAAGLDRDATARCSHVLPGVRFAADAYLQFARTAPWQEAVAACLTELFAAEAHRARIESFPKFYPWIRPEGLRYFQSRLDQAGRDADHGLELTLQHFRTRAQQERAIEILNFKLDVLWSLLDAIDSACRDDPRRYLPELIQTKPIGLQSEAQSKARNAVHAGNSADGNDGAALTLAPGMRLQWEEAQQNFVLLYPEGMVRLNESAAEILRLCSESPGLTAAQLLDELASLYDARGAERERLQSEVRAFLSTAQSRGWIRHG